MSRAAPASRVNGCTANLLLRVEIEQMRQRPTHGAPVRERPSDASLQQRLRGLLDDNRALREEVQAMKHELALAYGAQRTPLATTNDDDHTRAGDPRVPA
jgi:hypothetical protein